MRERKHKDPEIVRLDTFSMRVNAKERRLIARLADELQRSLSDAVRFVVVNAAKEIKLVASKSESVGVDHQAESDDGINQTNSSSILNNDEVERIG